MRNPGLDEAKAGIKIAGRNINNIRYANDITFMAESKEDSWTEEPVGYSPWGHKESDTT